MWRKRSRLEVRLPPLRAELNFTPAPATVDALKAALTGVRERIAEERPPAEDARLMRGRVNTVLTSGLAAPPAEPA
jgi:hypothetical protein